MIASQAYFVCGTDTDVGKTTVCAGLLRNMPHAHGIKVIQTGEGLIDQHVYTDAYKNAKVKTLFHLSFAASPHLAAKRENRVLNYQEIKHQVRQEVDRNKLTIIEGSGGIMTPITTTKNFCDLMSELGYPVILVIKNVLGAINHALLTINTLRHYGIPIKGLIFTTPSVVLSEEQRIILEDNCSYIAETVQLPVLSNIPYIPHLTGDHPSWAQLSEYLEPTSAMLSGEDSIATDSTLTDFDKKHVWHPYEQAQSSLAKPVIVRAACTQLTLGTGQIVTDGMSSWWSVIHGYSHPDLINAIQSQSRKLSHVMFGGLTHQPAIQLAQKLLSIVPSGLQHVFYADSGSVAIEVAIKMAIQYWQGKKQAGKSKFISFYGGYHGDTCGAMSISDPDSAMRSLPASFIPKNIFAPRPDVQFGAEFNPSSLNALRQLCEKHHDECAAVVIEPIVQAAGGMWFYHPEYLKGVRDLCDEFGLLLIVDEIAVGFGRTGKLFASEWAGITPDIMCIGKAITGGMLTLSATLSTSEVANGIETSGKPLMHGPTYMGNPLACQVAIASIDLLIKNGWENQVKRIEKQLKQELSLCETFHIVKNVRVLGAIGVVELNRDVEQHQMQYDFLKQNVWIRPIGRLIYLMPPYVSTDEDIHLLCKSIVNIVKEYE